MLKFHKELKRRKMFRPLVTYAAFSFVLIQVCSIVFPALLLPDWTNTFIVVLVILGFPVTVFFAWVYDITPEGIQKTSFASISAENNQKSRKVLAGELLSQRLSSFSYGDFEMDGEYFTTRFDERRIYKKLK